MDLSSIPTYTDADLLLVYRNALVALGVSQEYTMPDGRRLRRADLKEIRATIDWLEERAAGAGGDGGIGLVRYGERV